MKNVRRREGENHLGQLSLTAVENSETEAATARNNIFLLCRFSVIYRAINSCKSGPNTQQFILSQDNNEP
jgi:hypothetical protein